MASGAPGSPRLEAQSAPAPEPRKVEWWRAGRALRELVRDPERTDRVFELIQALGGDSGERNYQSFLRHPEGRELVDFPMAALPDQVPPGV